MRDGFYLPHNIIARGSVIMGPIPNWSTILATANLALRCWVGRAASVRVPEESGESLGLVPEESGEALRPVPEEPGETSGPVPDELRDVSAFAP